MEYLFEQYFNEMPCYVSVQGPDLKLIDANRRFRDDFGLFEEETAEAAARGGRFPPNSKQAKALAALNLHPNASLEEVKARYKVLAKELHPDRNGGDSEAEERLKIINLAYSDLKAAF